MLLADPAGLDLLDLVEGSSGSDGGDCGPAGSDGQGGFCWNQNQQVWGRASEPLNLLLDQRVPSGSCGSATNWFSPEVGGQG